MTEETKPTTLAENSQNEETSSITNEVVKKAPVKRATTRRAPVKKAVEINEENLIVAGQRGIINNQKTVPS